MKWRWSYEQHQKNLFRCWSLTHGGKDPGAVKYVKEAEVNIKVVKYMYNYLNNNYVCNVYKDISDDSLNTICNRANGWGADLFVSIHFNAGKNTARMHSDMYLAPL